MHAPAWEDSNLGCFLDVRVLVLVLPLLLVVRVWV